MPSLTALLVDDPFPKSFDSPCQQSEVDPGNQRSRSKTSGRWNTEPPRDRRQSETGHDCQDLRDPLHRTRKELLGFRMHYRVSRRLLPTQDLSLKELAAIRIICTKPTTAPNMSPMRYSQWVCSQ